MMPNGQPIQYTEDGEIIVPTNMCSIGGTVMRGGTPPSEPGYYHRYRLTGAVTQAGMKHQMSNFMDYMLERYDGFQVLIAKDAEVYCAPPLRYTAEIVYVIPAAVRVDKDIGRFAFRGRP